VTAVSAAWTMINLARGLQLQRVAPVRKAHALFKQAAARRSLSLGSLADGGGGTHWDPDADRRVVLAAVAKNGRALVDASDELRADKDVVLAAVAQNGLALEDASDELRVDKEVVLAAVTRDGWALRFAADELRADKEVALAAVTQNGRALQYVAHELRADKDIGLAASWINIDKIVP
jgi:uncharacterized protein YoaH (UPF0181 family)